MFLALSLVLNVLLIFYLWKSRLPATIVVRLTSSMYNDLPTGQIMLAERDDLINAMEGEIVRCWHPQTREERYILNFHLESL